MATAPTQFTVGTGAHAPQSGKNSRYLVGVSVGEARFDGKVCLEVITTFGATDGTGYDSETKRFTSSSAPCRLPFQLDELAPPGK